MQVTPILTGTLFLLHLPTLTAMPHHIHRISLLVIISRFFLLHHLALAEELVLINDYYSVCESYHLVFCGQIYDLGMEVPLLEPCTLYTECLVKLVM